MLYYYAQSIQLSTLIQIPQYDRALLNIDGLLATFACIV